MNLGKDVTIDLKSGVVEISAYEGKLKVTAAVGMFAAPVLASLEADVNSGKIDPIKGTDLDKTALLQVIAFLKKQVGIDASVASV